MPTAMPLRAVDQQVRERAPAGRAAPSRSRRSSAGNRPCPCRCRPAAASAARASRDLGVAHRRRRIAVDRAEIALPVDQRHAHRERLRHAHHGVVDRQRRRAGGICPSRRRPRGPICGTACPACSRLSCMPNRMRRCTGFSPSRASGSARRRSPSWRSRGRSGASPLRASPAAWRREVREGWGNRSIRSRFAGVRGRPVGVPAVAGSIAGPAVAAHPWPRLAHGSCVSGLATFNRCRLGVGYGVTRIDFPPLPATAARDRRGGSARRGRASRGLPRSPPSGGRRSGRHPRRRRRRGRAPAAPVGAAHQHRVAALELAFHRAHPGRQQELPARSARRRAGVDRERARGLQAAGDPALARASGPRARRGTRCSARPRPARRSGCAAWPRAITMAQPAWVAIRAAASLVPIPPEPNSRAAARRPSPRSRA